LPTPFLLMVAGPNGAGKTTLIDSLRAQNLDLGEHINPDDIAAGLEGSYESRVAEAQIIADRRREACIAGGRSFSFETVMSHPSKVEILHRARAAGFFVQLFFVGIDDPRTSVERVANLVALGGHDVPKDRIVARWTRTMKLLHQAIVAADQAYVFDNSASIPFDRPRLVWSRTRERGVMRIEAYGPVPAWVREYAAADVGSGFHELDDTIDRATRALLDLQRPDGHWVFELEADCTIPSEYVLLTHYFGEDVDLELERKIAVYLRRIQGAHGGWALFHAGAFDMSASVKAYFALKMIGDSPDAEHMRRAREAILARGGAAASNVFTRILLSLFGILSWRSVPVMPVEIMLLPKWFPFHIDKISYWGRTVIVPLLVLMALKPQARNPRAVRVDELFVAPPATVGPPHKAPHQKWSWFLFFRGIDAVLRAAEPLFPKRLRRRAIDRAVAWTTERLNGVEGLGAIFPAMANSVMMYAVLGYPRDHPHRSIARASLDKLLVVKDDEAYCQPCVSPVWDTGLTCHTLMEVGDGQAVAHAHKGLEWLEPLQVLDVKGDWAQARPNVRPGGWAFQYANAHYPDLDDTAVVVMAMDRVRARAGTRQFDGAIERAREWVEGLQSRGGGWAAFDADNTYYYLNNIPFADHGALLDPPTEDVTARCVSMLAQLGQTSRTNPAITTAIDYLRRTQLRDGSWYGRWGMNYIYGTWSVLCALNAAGVDRAGPEIRKAVDWLLAIQNPDGGWGEDGTSYKLDYRGYEPAPSTASQTAWALLGLMAAGEVDHPAVERGIGHIAKTQQPDGLWSEEHFTATGFPRVFYLRYHGYRKFFPIWALARYRNLRKGNSRSVAFGM
jgi:squalene-hopene/tetraprenyl-beta-curcumene cyclase